MSHKRSGDQGCSTIPTADVDEGSVRKQPIGGFGLVQDGCDVERAVTVCIGRIEIGSSCQMFFQRTDVTCPCSRPEIDGWWRGAVRDDYVLKVVPVSRQLGIPARDLILVQQISGNVGRFFIAQTTRSRWRHGVADGINHVAKR